MKKYFTILMLFISVTCWSQTIYHTVEFSIGTSEIIHNKNYEVFTKDIVPFMETNIIKDVYLIGCTSPEGNKNLNNRLANERANLIKTYIEDYVPKNKIYIQNNYNLFLEKTGYDESDYNKLRATYIEIHYYQNKDTIYIEKPVLDTLYIYTRDTIKVENLSTYDLSFSIYNSLSEDFLMRKNIGVEAYFKKMSFFIEGSFSNDNIFGKNYDIQYWHTGLRKYFDKYYNGLFIEGYLRMGYFDTNLFSKNGVFGLLYGAGLAIGYKFDLKGPWKIYPILRIGADRFHFKNYYYYDSNGNLTISFGNYKDGKIKESESISEQNQAQGFVTKYYNKDINKSFLQDAYKGLWIGPTYIGITIQRDFKYKRRK